MEQDKLPTAHLTGHYLAQQGHLQLQSDSALSLRKCVVIQLSNHHTDVTGNKSKFDFLIHREGVEGARANPCVLEYNKEGK